MSTTLNIICGKIGAGKSTLARELETQGVTRLSIDDKALEKAQMFRDPENDYRIPEQTLRQAEKDVSAENLVQACRLLRDGKSVVFDYGFWTKSDREWFRQLAHEHGVEFVLYYLEIDPAEQWRRLEARNQGDLSAVHFISREEMEYFNSLFEPPVNEGEIRIQPKRP